MSRDDVHFAAGLHERCLRHGLFPLLGARFLGTYLSTFLGAPHAVALVAELDGKLVGFLVGTFDDEAHRRVTVRANTWRLIRVGALALLSRPGTTWMFLRTRSLRYARGLARLARPRRRSGRGAPVRQASAGVLSHVAVDASNRRCQAGRSLVEDFIAQARARGIAAVRLVTLEGEAGAGRFYASLGWQHDGSYEDRDGVQWSRYRLELC